MIAQRRILDEARHVAQLQRTELQRIDAGELQPSQPDVADAGAQRVGDRRDAEALRGRPRDHGVLGAGVDDEVLRRPSFTLARTTTFSFTSAEVDGVELVVGARIGFERHALTERSQEFDLGGTLVTLRKRRVTEEEHRKGLKGNVLKPM